MTICIVCIMAVLVLPDQLLGGNIQAWQQHAFVGQD